MGLTDRREADRVPLQLFLNEFVQDDPRRCMAVNLSPSGICLNRLLSTVYRPTEVVGLEFTLVKSPLVRVVLD